MKGGKSDLNYIFVKLSDFNTKNVKVPLMTKVHTPVGLFGGQLGVLLPGGLFRF